VKDEAMTTITIDRALLEDAAEFLDDAVDYLAKPYSTTAMVTAERLRSALAAPATAAEDRHAKELLAQDITLQNMAERHAQELCAYELTVDKLRAERKQIGPDDAVSCMFAADIVAPPNKILALIRAVEAHHGIGDKT
jgi:hypothetical protein